ncbi:hypothetical protein THAOC_29654 [Thalassiosira oceanica]|uniref:Uncharacterized protein n=1 Tax=Thalassiosira oceanica TaxID=159749 RepID=K0RDE4_THAOC|nr:hypothetical protein THAOC_29654 [Thalassiosira oceanica]|eukprot:EJK51195.1 hypothetical protein THAOC_29654 [Thalassiosira oceanica]
MHDSPSPSPSPREGSNELAAPRRLGGTTSPASESSARTAASLTCVATPAKTNALRRDENIHNHTSRNVSRTSSRPASSACSSNCRTPRNNRLKVSESHQTGIDERRKIMHLPLYDLTEFPLSGVTSAPDLGANAKAKSDSAANEANFIVDSFRVDVLIRATLDFYERIGRHRPWIRVEAKHRYPGSIRKLHFAGGGTALRNQGDLFLGFLEGDIVGEVATGRLSMILDIVRGVKRTLAACLAPHLGVPPKGTHLESGP